MPKPAATPELRSLIDFAWLLPPGPHNAITDVPGVRVGHATMLAPGRGVCTGITVVEPGTDLIGAPLPAAVHVINGYGKSAGLMQIQELGELESPIALTGVFGVPSVLGALVRRLMEEYPIVGDEPTGRSVNAVVMECNDSYLNDPRAECPGENELSDAFASATQGLFERGTVGAGVGMGTFGFAGGIGTASRLLEESGTACVGALVLTNFGKRRDLVIAGRPVGRWLDDHNSATARPGSVIVVLATDLALTDSALRRISRRAQNGLARTGCATTSGSGEVVIAFATNRPADGHVSVELLDHAFRAVAECVEEAVLDSLCSARASMGRSGRIREAMPFDRVAELLGGDPRPANSRS